MTFRIKEISHLRSSKVLSKKAFGFCWKFDSKSSKVGKMRFYQLISKVCGKCKFKVEKALNLTGVLSEAGNFLLL